MSTHEVPNNETAREANFNRNHPELKPGEEWFNNMNLEHARALLNSSPTKYRIGTIAYNNKGEDVALLPVSMVHGKRELIVPVFKKNKTE